MILCHKHFPTVQETTERLKAEAERLEAAQLKTHHESIQVKAYREVPNRDIPHDSDEDDSDEVELDDNESAVVDPRRLSQQPLAKSLSAIRRQLQSESHSRHYSTRHIYIWLASISRTNPTTRNFLARRYTELSKRSRQSTFLSNGRGHDILFDGGPPRLGKRAHGGWRLGSETLLTHHYTAASSEAVTGVKMMLQALRRKSLHGQTYHCMFWYCCTCSCTQHSK